MAADAIRNSDTRFPVVLRERLGAAAPSELFSLGNLSLLSTPKTALFYSVRSPGSAILAAYDQAAHWRDTERCVISGFHSPIEKECLRILLRGRQPIIICPARSVENMRLPADWKAPIAAGRLLILSGFNSTHRRATTELATRRNEFVAALADEVWFAHIAPGGQTERLAKMVARWSPASTP